jgi:hypothetical protein
MAIVLARNRAFPAPGALAEHSGTTSPTALLAITTMHFDAVKAGYIRGNQRTVCRWWLPRPRAAGRAGPSRHDQVDGGETFAVGGRPQGRA